MAKQKAMITERMTQIILNPVVTEKSGMVGEQNKIVFKVAADATKPEIKQAVEALYGVEVTKVNTVNTKGKVKRFRGLLGKRNDMTKAYVTLKHGQSIDLGTGI